MLKISTSARRKQIISIFCFIGPFLTAISHAASGGDTSSNPPTIQTTTKALLVDPNCKTLPVIISSSRLETAASLGEVPYNKQYAIYNNNCNITTVNATKSTIYNTWMTEPAVYVTSVAEISKHATNKNIKRIIYDLEDWSFSPVKEIKNPIQASCNAINQAKNNNKYIILAPSLNVFSKSNGAARLSDVEEGRYFEKLAQCSTPPDGIVLQLQGSLTNTNLYAHYVKTYTSQIKAVSNKIFVFPSLRSNSDTTAYTISSGHIRNAINATKSSADGYLFLMPVSGAGCKNCPEITNAQIFTNAIEQNPTLLTKP